MKDEALDLALEWQNKDWNSESPMSADLAISAANNVINALMQALAAQPATEDSSAVAAPVQDLLEVLEALCNEYGQAMTLMNHKTPRRAMWSKALAAIDKAKEWGQATPPAAPASWMEMVTANLVREGVNKHKARELAGHFYGLAAPIPDAITDNSESPEYRAGWNECRELTIQMRKS
jgi:hypothetical protein